MDRRMLQGIKWRAERGGQPEVRVLLLLHETIELASLAVAELRGKGPLYFAATEGSGDDPAASPAVASSVDRVQAAVRPGRTHPQLRDASPSRLAPALLELPAVQLGTATARV
jgi:hypothetical protein